MLKEIHGNNPNRTDLAVVYSTAIIGTAGLLAYLIREGVDLSLLQGVILAALMLDILGGVVANMTQSTNDFYAHAHPRHSYFFLLIHFIQPLILTLVFEPGWDYFAFLYLYGLGAGSLVVWLRGSSHQRPVAAALYVIGVLLYAYLFSPPLALVWLGYMYFAKLILAFGIDHYR